MWRLVVACWLVSYAVFLPAVWVVGGAASEALGDLPSNLEAIPDGDRELILLDALRQIRDPLRLAVVSGLITLWMWTVLWHAGVVNWALWTGGRRVRLGEVLGLGMVSWLRYARLSLTAAATLLLAMTALWYPLMIALDECHRSVAEQRAVLLVVGGVGLSTMVALVGWAATLHAAWLLGLPERRSVVLAWLRGLLTVLRTPVRSLASVMLWVLPAVLISVVPLLVGLNFDELRGGWWIPVLGQVAAGVRAFCWVGLFVTFAPVTGLVGIEDEDANGARPSNEAAPR
jgi:hypothetical protein